MQNCVKFHKWGQNTAKLRGAKWTYDITSWVSISNTFVMSMTVKSWVWKTGGKSSNKVCPISHHLGSFSWSDKYAPTCNDKQSANIP